jgi:hypothetical protein
MTASAVSPAETPPPQPTMHAKPQWGRGLPTGPAAAQKTVSRLFPSWNRSILTEIYLCHACSCQNILRTETAGQAQPPHGAGAGAGAAGVGTSSAAGKTTLAGKGTPLLTDSARERRRRRQGQLGARANATGSQAKATASSSSPSSSSSSSSSSSASSSSSYTCLVSLGVGTAAVDRSASQAHSGPSEPEPAVGFVVWRLSEDVEQVESLARYSYSHAPPPPSSSLQFDRQLSLCRPAESWRSVGR